MSAEQARRTVVSCHQADADGYAEGHATIAVFRERGRAVMATGASWLTSVRLTNAEAVQLVTALLATSRTTQQEVSTLLQRFWDSGGLDARLRRTAALNSDVLDSADADSSSQQGISIRCRVGDTDGRAIVTVFRQHGHAIMVTKSHWTTAVRLTSDETIELVSALLMAAGADPRRGPRHRR